MTKNERNKNYRLRNRDRINKKRRDEYKHKRNEIIEKQRTYHANNKEKIIIARKKWVNENKEKLKENYNKWQKEKYHNDIKFKVKKDIRNRLNTAFKKYSKNGKICLSNEYGIDIEQIIKHLGPRPGPEYSIDHIIPLCYFNFDDIVQLWAAFLPINHRWITKEENSSKCNKILKEHIDIKNYIDNYILERKTNMKLHLGNGDVYLNGYINVDVNADYIVPNVPKDILELNSTTFDNYYKHKFNTGSKKVVVDVQSSIFKLPFENESVDEVVTLHVLEHIELYNINKPLNEIYRVLKPGGHLIVAVPDIKETAKLLANANTDEEEDWCIRLIHGTQRNEYLHHYSGFTPRTLKKLLSEYGFNNFEDLPNINFYPAIYLKACRR